MEQQRRCASADYAVFCLAEQICKSARAKPSMQTAGGPVKSKRRQDPVRSTVEQPRFVTKPETAKRSAAMNDEKNAFPNCCFRNPG